MTDVTDLVDADEAETVETDQVEDAADLDADEAEDGDDGDSQEEEETEEIERNGKKYRVAKDLVPDLLRQDVFTRKTQELAETRKALEAQQVAFTGATKEIDDKAFELKGIDRRLSDLTALSPTDWQEIARLDQQNGTNNYDRLNRELVTLPRQREGLAGELKAKEDEVLSATHALREKQWEEGQAVLARDIKGWGPELAEKLVKTATTDFGFSEQEARALDDPRWIKVFHEAHLNREQARKSQAQARADKAGAVKPISGVKGASSSKAGLSDDLSTAEWMKRDREKQMARKTGAVFRRA